MPETGPEIPRVEELVGEEGGHHHRYGKLVAVAIVLTTMIGALTAFAQAGSERLHDQADARAEQYGALALSAAAVNRGKADVEIGRLDLLTQQVRAADNASLFQTYGTASPATRLTSARWSAVAASTAVDTASIANAEGVPYICSPTLQRHCPNANASYSPERDARFPARYMQQGQWNAYRLTALRDAANQEADDAEGQFVHYAAALTMLAVAVFLFGYSLTPQGRSRRKLYSRVASAFVLVAGGWALFQVLSPVSRSPDAAATAFADGEVALNVGDYPTAISDFSRALAMRPRFVDAYAERAQAEFGAGFPHTGTGTSSQPTTAGPATIPALAAVDRAVADDHRARDEGSNSATLLADLGKGLFYQGALTRNRGDLLASRTDLASSVAALKGQDNVSALLATEYLRLAEDDLALGDPAAGGEFRQAEAELQQPDVPKEATVAAALTDLSLIESTFTRLATRADAFKQQIVAAGVGGASAPAGAPVQLAGVTAEPDPGHALFTIAKPGSFNPSRDTLSVQWEYKDPLHGEWAVLPEISGPVGPGGVQASGSGYVSNNIAYPSSTDPATCLPPGKYQVQLYVNGHLAGSAQATGSWAALHAVRFSDVDGAVCVPVGWQPFAGASPGTDGYLAKDQSAGAIILSVPEAAASVIAHDPPSLASVMQSVVQGLSGPGSYLPHVQPLGKPQPTPFFMSSSNAQYQQWAYKNGAILSGVGTSSNGEIYIGVAWGPPRSTLTPQLFLSLSPL